MAIPRPRASCHCGSASLPATAAAVVVVVVLQLSAASTGAAAAGVDVKASCAATPHPDVCMRALGAASAASPRDLAEMAIRATSDVGAAAGSYARAELDVVKDTDTWQCLNECADDIEEAVSHLDDTEGEMGAAKFEDVRLFLDTAERDSFSCDDACKRVAETPVKATLLSRNKEFETMMAVTHSLIKQATGAGNDTAPAKAAP